MGGNATLPRRAEAEEINETLEEVTAARCLEAEHSAGQEVVVAPISTTHPAPRTTLRPAIRTVDKRCDTSMVMRPRRRAV